MNLDVLEKIVQLGIGVICAFALLWFISLEVRGIGGTLSDRAFWTLVLFAASGLALKDLLLILSRVSLGGSGPTYQKHEPDRETYRAYHQPDQDSNRSQRERAADRAEYREDNTDADTDTDEGR